MKKQAGCLWGIPCFHPEVPTCRMMMKNDKTVRGLGRKMRGKIGKRNKMTALRLQTGGRTSNISGLSSGLWHQMSMNSCRMEWRTQTSMGNTISGWMCLPAEWCPCAWRRKWRERPAGWSSSPGTPRVSSAACCSGLAAPTPGPRSPSMPPAPPGTNQAAPYPFILDNPFMCHPGGSRDNQV